MFFTENHVYFLLNRILIKLIFIYYLSNFAVIQMTTKKRLSSPVPKTSPFPFLFMQFLLSQRLHTAPFYDHTVHISGSPAFLIPSDLAL